MNHALKSLISVAVFLLSVFVVDVAACSCVARSGCEYASSSDVVFVGRVISTSEIVRSVTRRVRPLGGEWENRVSEERRQVSRVSVEDSFLGADGQKETLIETDLSSSCAFSLSEGVTYIIYADRSDSTENLMTGMCSGSKPVSEARDEIQMLRKERAKLSTVSGKIGFGRFFRLDPKRLEEFGVERIKLIGGESSTETPINSDGSFEFRGVPAGRYRLEPIIPDILIVDGEFNDEIAKDLEIEDQRLFSVNGIGCVKKQLPLRENGRIAGRLFDGKGLPVSSVDVLAVPVDAAGNPIKQDEACYDTDLCVSSDKDGRYLIKGLKPGRYLIGTRLDDWVCNDCPDARFKKTYYPGVASRSRAKVITVGLGKLVENIDLKLTNTYVEREIIGTVLSKEGRPLRHANVRYVSRTPDRKQNGSTLIKTDDAGNFRFVGYEGHSYLIGAYSDHGGEANDTTSRGVIIKIRPGVSLKPLRLVLDQKDTDVDFWEFDTPGLGR